MVKAISKKGAHGTLFLFAVKYTDSADDCCPNFVQRVWAYDAEHAETKFFDAPDADGWRIISIARIRDNGDRVSPA